ncbi:MAG: hypothetical protein V4493_01090 [Pseudomonadota bacterium]
MNYAEAKKIADDLWAASSVSSKAIEAFPKGPMGLTPDDVRATPEWKAAKALADHDFAKLRAWNGFYVKAFKKEIQAARNAKYSSIST